MTPRNSRGGDRARRNAESHRAAERAATVRKVVIGAVAGAVLVGSGVAVTYAVNATKDSPSTAASSTSAAAPTTSSTAAAAPNSASTTAAPSTASNAAAAIEAACVKEATAGDSFAAAASAVAADWRKHTSAQANVDAGKITAQAAQADWKASKARGPQDLATYAKTQTEYDKVKGTCGEAAGSNNVSQNVAQCMTRTAAITKIQTAAKPVAAGWTEHISNMKDKAHSDEAAYMTHWRQLVAQAPAQLRSYDTAAADLTKAPACS